MKFKLKRLLEVFSLAVLIGTACDPLGSPAQVIALAPTSLPTETPQPPLPPPSITPQPTITATDPPTMNSMLPNGACPDSQGQLVDDSFISKVNKGSVAYRAYLPPCYWETGRRYPYVILMHGSDSDQTEWTDRLNVNGVLDQGIDAGTLPPMVLIMPNGGALANLNVFQTGKSFESMMLNEFIPTIESRFCLWESRDGRAIGGISRGGFWAFEIGLRHPDLFSAIGGHSAFFDPENAPPDYNPLALARTVQFTPGLQPRMWLDTGIGDYARPNIEIFAQTLSARHIDPGFTEYPHANHDTIYWASHVNEYLTFYGQTWPADPGLLPTCLQ